MLPFSHSRLRRRTLLSLVAALVATAAPLARSAAAETMLRTMVSSDIRGLMPGTSPDVATGAVLQQIYEGLVAWRADGTVAPMLAETIDTSADGRTVTFTLRPGVSFHNGQPLTSREVVWTWQRFLDPKQPWQCRTNFDGTRQIRITGIEALDERRVAFHLAEPSGVFLSMMARSDCDSTGIAHPDSVDAEGRWVKAIGTGPFMLEEWRKGQYVQLARFAAYASRSEPTDGLSGAKRAGLDRIRFTLIPDPSTAKVALQSGNLDVWPEVDPTMATELRGARGLKVLDAPTAGLNAILMQSRDPVLADARVRQAIAIAIDTDGLREGLYAGYGRPGTSLVPSTSRNYGPVQQQGFGHDLAKARRLLREGGYAGRPVVITTNSQFGLMKDTAILLQAMLQAVGINAEVETIEFGAQLDRYFKGRYQVMIWNVTPYLDPIFSFDRFVGGPDASPDKVWRSAAANDLLARLFMLGDPAARQPIFDELHRLFLADAPLSIWINRATISGVSTRVQGFEPWAGLKPRFWNVTLGQ